MRFARVVAAFGWLALVSMLLAARPWLRNAFDRREGLGRPCADPAVAALDLGSGVRLDRPACWIQRPAGRDGVVLRDPAPGLGEIHVALVADGEARAALSAEPRLVRPGSSLEPWEQREWVLGHEGRRIAVTWRYPRLFAAAPQLEVMAVRVAGMVGSLASVNGNTETRAAFPPGRGR